MAELHFHQRLCKNVRDVVIHWDVFDLNFPVLDHFVNKVIADANVLGLCIKFIVLRQCDCTLIVTIDGQQFSVYTMYFTDEAAQLQRFFCGMHLCNIFSFSAREHDNMLFPGAP